MSYNLSSPEFSSGMNAREIRNYNYNRAWLATDPRTRTNCLEAEVSDTLKRKFGLGAGGGCVVPMEKFLGTAAQFEAITSRRTLLAGSASSGGYTIEGEAAPLLAYLFPKCRILSLGAELTPMFPRGLDGSLTVRGDLQIPIETSSDEAQWLAEDETATAGSSGFGAALLRAKRLYAQRTVSKQLLAQSDLGRQLERILAGAIAAALDRAALVGTGGKQPIGLLRNDRVDTIAYGADGAAPTATKLQQHITPIIQANAAMARPGWVLSPKVREKTALTPWFSGGSVPLLSTQGGRDQLVGFEASATSFLPDNLVKGNGTALGSAIFGDFSTLAVGIWPALVLGSDPFGSNARAGKTDVWVDGFADIVTPRPECFTRALDVSTS